MKNRLDYLLICMVGLTHALFVEARPNVLFVSVDDMNDWIAPLGGLSIAKTPNLDRFAAESTVFANAHTASPACASSRIATMTGVQPSKSGYMRNVWFSGPQWRDSPALAEIDTLDQFFRKRGYETLAGGKIYHSLAPPWLTSNQADPDGWDFYFPSVHVPMPYQVRAPNDRIFLENPKGKRPHAYFTWAPLDVRDEIMADNQVVDWARYVLDQKHEKPLYLAVGLFRPHMPWEVPQKYFDLYPLEDIPDLEIHPDDLEDAFEHGRRHWHEFVLANGEWKKVIQAYLACLTFADANLGRLLDGLEQSAYADNTAVALWSDHGMHLGEKENWEKFTLWEEATRIPLMIRPLGRKKGGQVCSAPVSSLDLYPTLVELAGFDPPEHCDGVSLVPLLDDPASKRERSALTSYAFSKQEDSEVGHSLRDERYRYIYYERLGLEELYDHEIDPNEFDNIAYDPRNATLVQRFRQELADRVGQVEIADMDRTPEGYSIKNGSIVSTKYEPLPEGRLLHDTSH